MPKVAAEFKALGLNVTTVDANKPIQGAQATGFVVSTAGHVVTCAHVLKDQDAATLWIDGKRYEADVLAKDDDALLKVRGTPAGALLPLNFRDDKRYEIGTDIFTIGFPLSNVLGSSARYTRGVLNAANGLKDDPKQVQFSAQIQPGSSGGPLFDKDGVVLGVIQQTSNPLRMLQQTGGALPQDVNFAIKSHVVLEFLQAQKHLYDSMTFNKGYGVDMLQKSVVKIRAGIISEEWEKTPKLVARVDYASRGDLWYRFPFFVVRLYDFDSQDLLLAAGQSRDPVATTEDPVIRNTFAEVRKLIEKK